MSGRGRDALSLSRSFLRTVQSTGWPPTPHCIPWKPCFVQVRYLSWCTTADDREGTLVQGLGPKKIQWPGPSLPVIVGSHPLRGTLYGNTRAYVLKSNSSYATSASAVEKPSTEGFLFGADGREEIKQAMAEYLEQTLRVQEELAVKISKTSPAYVDGLVERLKAVQEEDSSSIDKSLNVSVKELLAKAKFKGVEPFLESLGINPQEISRVKEYARSGVKGVLVKVDLLKAIGVMPEEIPRILVNNPRFLSNALVSQKVKVEYLTQLGMTPVEICKLIISYPNSLSFSLKEDGLPLVTFLKNAGVKDEDICKVLTRCPQLLTLNVERKLLPAIEILESVGITGSYLARVLVMQPSLLRRRLERNIAFCREFGLDAKPGVIARLLVTCPNFSVDGFTQRVSYLNSIGLSKEQIVSMINKNPAFMSLNVKTSLAPKVNYLMNVMGRQVDQLVTAATFLTMSLQHRIKPRHQVLAALQEISLLSRTYSLTTMVTWSDDYFYKKFVSKSPQNIQNLWNDYLAANAPAVDNGVSFIGNRNIPTADSSVPHPITM